jgi:Chitobiase/beta-hexosaminidase C-terminal domain
MTHVAMIGSSVVGNASGVFLPDAGGGATQVFNFANFSGAPGTINRANSAFFIGSTLQLCGNPDQHQSGAAYYTTKQPPSAFTTIFSFTPAGIGAGTGGTALASGMTFCIQNTVSPPAASSALGLTFADDANMCGYGGATDQNPPVGSICIKFDASPLPGGGLPYSHSGAPPCSTGMYFNGGPAVSPTGSLVMFPINDLVPSGFNFYSGDTYQATIVYDGNVLVMVLLDTTTGVQARFEWPLNLANTTNAAGNYVGFTGGTSSQGNFQINSWSYFSGFNTRLATPTFSPTPGQYSGTQTVTISGPSGAAIYYTTNGLLPTSASTLYTGTISVTANEVIQAVAIQSGFTDSFVATGAYQIGTSNHINFPSGFAASDLLPIGYAYLSGSAYRLTDTVQDSPGALWWKAPVTVSSFSTAFTLQFGTGGGAHGTCFVVQNNPPAYSGLNSVQIAGTGGQISFAAPNVPLTAGQFVNAAGTFGGTGSISGYSSPTLYCVLATNGTSTATLVSNVSFLNSFQITGTSGQVSFSSTPVSVGQYVTIEGVSLNNLNQPVNYINGYATPTTTYLVSATNGTTTATLQTLGGGALTTTVGTPAHYSCILQSPLTTTVGTPSGLTFSPNTINWSGGPTALGCNGAACGYGGMNADNGTNGNAFGLLNSVAILFDINNGTPNSVGLYTDGATPQGNQTASGLTFAGGSFNVTLTYSGTTLALTMQSTGGGTVFSHNFTIDIPGTVGLSTGYVGFTGAGATVQAVTAWTMT